MFYRSFRFIFLFNIKTILFSPTNKKRKLFTPLLSKIELFFNLADFPINIVFHLADIVN